MKLKKILFLSLIVFSVNSNLSAIPDMRLLLKNLIAKNINIYDIIEFFMENLVQEYQKEEDNDDDLELSPEFICTIINGWN
ncbi:hypothetical protein M1446_03835 [Candidatus Dependentiae bacterium]|nr:hypothetical protein [Candidatus Dependentiae bacterium]